MVNFLTGQSFWWKLGNLLQHFMFDCKYVDEHYIHVTDIFLKVYKNTSRGKLWNLRIKNLKQV